MANIVQVSLVSLNSSDLTWMRELWGYLCCWWWILWVLELWGLTFED